MPPFCILGLSRHNQGTLSSISTYDFFVAKQACLISQVSNSESQRVKSSKGSFLAMCNEE